jgi:hypothetical protein
MFATWKAQLYFKEKFENSKVEVQAHSKRRPASAI